MNKVLALLLVLVVLGGCEQSPYDGYDVVDDDVHLRLLVIGDGEVLPSDSDSVVVRLRMGSHAHEVGSIFSTERAYLVKDIRRGAMMPILHRLHVGDSLSVVAPVSSWPWSVLAKGAGIEVPDTGMVQAELLLLALRTPSMRRAELRSLRQHDPLRYEQRLMAAWITRTQEPFSQWGTSDVWYRINGRANDTNAVAVGDQVTIGYQGHRVEDGYLFDDTHRNGASLSFTYGDKDQVINGLEVAVTLLRPGQEGRFVFPSAYAFGAKGIPGVLDPYMPVDYTVRLENVVRGAQEHAVR